MHVSKRDAMTGHLISKPFVSWLTGANPPIVSYNASAVNIYNATSSLAHCKNKNIFFCFEKTQDYFNGGCKFEGRSIEPGIRTSGSLPPP
jgi:hypothetical protein